MSETQWRPIETAPKTGVCILAHWDKSGESEVVYYSNEASEEGFRWATDAGYVSTPTHWMPLPEPPKQA